MVQTNFSNSMLSPPKVKETRDNETSIGAESADDVDSFCNLQPQPTTPRLTQHLTNSDHTFLSADGVRVSFITAKQTEAEIEEYERLQGEGK